MPELRLLSDQPTSGLEHERLDGLSFGIYAEVLANAAANTPGPFTIGVFGEWGTGKTSLMRMIKRDLDENYDNVVTVWFNAWRYERESHPIVPLVASIIRQLERNRDLLETAKDKGRSLIRSLRAVAYGFSAKSKVQVPGFAEVEAGFVAKDMIDREEKLTPDPLLDRSLYYEAFEALSKAQDAQNPKIVVIVDDLDRCFPNRAIALLESIKLVLAQPGFIFVIGVARTVIEGYLQHRYTEEFGLREFAGNEYLDKIVQLPFYIPPHRARVETFVDSLLQQLAHPDREEFREVLPIIVSASGSNPRTIIRFVNNLLIDRAIFHSIRVSERESVPLQYFAISRALQMRWPRVYRMLTGSNNLCHIVAEWCSDKRFPQDDDHFENYGREGRLAQSLANELAADGRLWSLLADEGLKWLQDEEMRERAVSFLKVERGEVAPEQIDSEVSIMEIVERSLRKLSVMQDLDLRFVSREHGPHHGRHDFQVGLAGDRYGGEFGLGVKANLSMKTVDILINVAGRIYPENDQANLFEFGKQIERLAAGHNLSGHVSVEGESVRMNFMLSLHPRRHDALALEKVLYVDLTDFFKSAMLFLEQVSTLLKTHLIIVPAPTL